MADDRVARILKRQKEREEKMRRKDEQLRKKEEAELEKKLTAFRKPTPAVPVKETSNLASEQSTEPKHTGAYMGIYASDHSVEAKTGSSRWERGKDGSWVSKAGSLNERTASTASTGGKYSTSSREAGCYVVPTSSTHITGDRYASLRIGVAVKNADTFRVATEVLAVIIQQWWPTSFYNSFAARQAMYRDIQLMYQVLEERQGIELYKNFDLDRWIDSLQGAMRTFALVGMAVARQWDLGDLATVMPPEAFACGEVSDGHESDGLNTKGGRIQLCERESLYQYLRRRSTVLFIHRYVRYGSGMTRPYFVLFPRKRRRPFVCHQMCCS